MMRPLLLALLLLMAATVVPASAQQANVDPSVIACMQQNMR